MAYAACIVCVLTLAVTIVLAEDVQSLSVSTTAAAVTWQTAAAQVLQSPGRFVQDDTSPSADCSNAELYHLELDNLVLPTLANNYTVAVNMQAPASQSQADAVLYTFGDFAVTVNRPRGKQPLASNTRSC
jgi:hypothetical protein